MDNKKWRLTEKEKNKFIDALTGDLAALRAKAGVPQDNLSKLIGISRQTYGSIERKTRRMSWSTYLSLILFFDCNKATHDMLRDIDAFPTELVDRFNDGAGVNNLDISSMLDITEDDLFESLDERALETIKTVVMLEYARCKELPGEAIVKSFDGKNFITKASKDDVKAKKALKRIRKTGK